MNTIDEMTMDSRDESAVPWWAAFGAPLVGVPLLVGLLALGSPDATVEAAPPVPDASLTSEQVEVPPAPEVGWVEASVEGELPEAFPRC